MADEKAAGSRRRWIFVAAGVVVVVGGLALWHYFSLRESTDDAEVSGHVSPVAPRVGGTVVAVHVNDNQPVKAGDVLVELDPHDYQVAVAKAQADLDAAEAALAGARTGVPLMNTQATNQQKAAQATSGTAQAAVLAASREVDVANAQLAAARAHVSEVKANTTRADQDLARMKQLVAKDEVSQQQYDNAVAAADAAHAAVQSAEAAVTQAQANVAAAEAKHGQAESALAQAQAEAEAATTAPEQVEVTKARASGAEAQVEQARATLEQATLNLQRTTIRASIDGIVTNKTVEVGQVVQSGQPLLAIVELTDVWITANFKETQLTDMKPGQAASISVDSTNRTYRGHVQSIAAATGATFSLLPPENATGNFVKVVQRVPVKVVLEPGEDTSHALRPGMSATVTVFVK